MLNQFWHKSSFKLNQFWHWLYQTWLTCYSIDPTKYGPKHSFKIRSAGRPGARAGSGWRKNRGRKNPMWPGDLVKNHGCNPLTFVLFFTKTMLFWFKKKKELTRATRWPSQNLEPGPWTEPATGPGLKTMVQRWLSQH
jgi:hypothetical protein